MDVRVIVEMISAVTVASEIPEPDIVALVDCYECWCLVWCV